MEKSFLVIGTGEVGLAMLNSLLTYQQTHSFKIGVLVQRSRVGKDEVSQHENYKNITIEAADLVADTRTSLAAIFRNYDTVICCSGFSIGGGMQVKITEAVLEAGVRRYIPWQFGADYDKIGKGSAQPVFDEQLDVRHLLRSQNKTYWIIVSTGMITSFLFREDFGVISLKNKTISALGDWKHSLTLTSCEDIAALTVAILFQTPEISDQVVFVAGDTVTFEEIADKMDALYNTKFQRVLLSIPILKENLEKDPDNIFHRYRLVFTHPGVTWPMATTFNAQNGILTKGIVQWAKENLLEQE